MRKIAGIVLLSGHLLFSLPAVALAQSGVATAQPRITPSAASQDDALASPMPPGQESVRKYVSKMFSRIRAPQPAKPAQASSLRDNSRAFPTTDYVSPVDLNTFGSGSFPMASHVHPQIPTGPSSLPEVQATSTNSPFRLASHRKPAVIGTSPAINLAAVPAKSRLAEEEPIPSLPHLPLFKTLGRRNTPTRTEDNPPAESPTTAVERASPAKQLERSHLRSTTGPGIQLDRLGTQRRNSYPGTKTQLTRLLPKQTSFGPNGSFSVESVRAPLQEASSLLGSTQTENPLTTAPVSLGEEVRSNNPQLRDDAAWSPEIKTWVSGTFHYHPLYFEQVNLERYGYGPSPLLKPFASSAHFFGSILVMPYKMYLNLPCEEVYPLGHQRPGDRACYQRHIHALR